MAKYHEKYYKLSQNSFTSCVGGIYPPLADFLLCKNHDSAMSRVFEVASIDVLESSFQIDLFLS